MPAKRINPPAKAAEQIQTLASTGFSIVGIAMHFSVSEETLARWFKDYPSLNQAFKAGREQERHALHNALYRKAVEKADTVAAIFLLKARHGYREGDQSDSANKVAITFNLPGAMTAEQYALAKVAKVAINGNSTGNAVKQLPTIVTERS